MSRGHAPRAQALWRDLPAGHKLWLADPALAWRVVAGEADVFVQPVSLENGGIAPAGARTFVARMVAAPDAAAVGAASETAGCCMFGAEPAAAPQAPGGQRYVWLLCPLAGCRVQAAEIERLFEEQPKPWLGAAAIGFAGLAASVLAPVRPDGPCVALDPGSAGGMIDAATGAAPESSSRLIRRNELVTALGTGALLRVEPYEGLDATVVGGRVGLSVLGSSALFCPIGGIAALPGNAWARPVARIRIGLVPPETVGAAQVRGLAASWLAFHAEQAALQRQAEPAALAVRRERSDAALKTALARLASLARRPRALAEVEPEPGEPPLAQAMRWIADAIGAPKRGPFDPATLRALQTAGPAGGGDAGAFGADPVAIVGAAIGLRHRAVTLRGRWWHADSGPLLARRPPPAAAANRPASAAPAPADDTTQPDPGSLHTADDDWLPLLFVGGRYVAVERAGAEPRAVDADFAAALSGTAFAFYRGLPREPLKLGNMLRWLLAGRRRDLRGILGVSLMVGALALMVPIATRVLFDTVLPSASRADLWLLIAALLVSALSSAAFEFARSVLVVRVESAMGGELQAAVWDRVLSLPMGFFRQYSIGDLVSRVNAVNFIRQQLTGTLLPTLLSSIFAAFNLGLMLFFNAHLALLGLGLIALAVAAGMGFGRLKLAPVRDLSRLEGRLAGIVYELLSGIAKIRAGAAEQRAFARWAEPFAAIRRLATRSQAVSFAESTFFAAYQPLTSMALFAMARSLPGGTDAMTTGEFIAFFAAFGAVFNGTLELSRAALSLVALLPEAERMQPVLRTEPEVREGALHPGRLRGRIEVSNLSFAYRSGAPEAAAAVPVLRNLGFAVEPGQFVALVGPSGSGKSTLMRLLLGFEKPDAGSIQFDGQNLADLDPRDVRRQIGTVFQSSHLLPGDLYSNITGGDPRLSLADAWNAARLAGMEDDIRDMPMGMQTLIGEGSSTLSGGQRQRLMIARALVKRPRILLLDEATSALDNRTQAIVQRSLDVMKITRLVIAHRLSTVRRADRILVIQAGQVVQAGGYDELVAVDGVFREMALRQQA
ncbi:MAG: NHLP bacteriocin export ABC transporter permease/ATPase subunit [Nevskia sp.]|nr:NHLP bacteriocin export ABC transporter permease/ATPase subunit [Nevskia sp.]